MAEAGVKTVDLAQGVLDEVLGNQVVDGVRRTRRAPLQSLLMQMLGSASGIAMGMLGYSSRDELMADLSPDARRVALVIGDGAPGHDGLYLKQGASGEGLWSQVLDFVPGAQIVSARNTGAGTPDAIQVETDLAVSASGGQIISVEVLSANAGTPVTVEFPGLGALIVKTASGNDVVPGGMPAGLWLGHITGGTFRLLSDQASAAIVAAAEAAQEAAEEARSAAQAAAAAAAAHAGSAIGIDPVGTVAIMKSVSAGSLAEGKVFELQGYSAAGDGGGGRVVYLGSSSATADDATIFAHDSEPGRFIRLDAEIDLHQVGLAGAKTDAPRLSTLLRAGVKVRKPDRITSLAQIAAKWAAGQKAPIVCFGDSQTDGRVSTTDGVNEMTLYNSLRLVGNNVPDSLTYDHDETEAPNAWPSVLQRMARALTGNNVLRVYNAGYRGRRADDGWACTNIHNAFWGNATYADAELAIIMFGTNDSESASGETLRQNTYYEHKALILDCFARGVQPVLATTIPIVSTSYDELDYGWNREVTMIVDNVKRDLADEFGLEVVDFWAGMTDWYAKNNRPYTKTGIISDGIHFSDIGHQMQAGYVLAKHLYQTIVPTIDGDCIVDASQVALSYRRSHSGFRNQGWAGRTVPREPIGLSAAGLISSKGLNLYDFWCWCEHPDLSVEYVASATANNPSSVGDAANLPQLIGTAMDFTDVSHGITLYDGPLPSLIGGAAGSTRTGHQRYWIGRLQYGLNRVRVYIPAGIDGDSAWLASAEQYFGWFNIVSDHANARPAMAPYTLDADLNTVRPWRNVLRDDRLTMASVAPSAGTTPRVLLPDARDGQNCYGLRKPGDAVEWLLRWPAVNGFGVVLGATRFAQNGTNFGAGFDKYRDVMMGSHFVVYDSTTIRFASYSAIGGNVLSPLDTGLTSATYADEVLRIRMEVTAIDELSLTVYDDAGTQLWTTTITSGAFIREHVAGTVGGLWNNRGLATTGAVTIDLLAVREMYASS